MSRHIKFVLLVSAYAPGLIVAALLQPDIWIAAAYVLLALASAAVLRLVLGRTESSAIYGGGTTLGRTLHRPRFREAELAGFLLAYLIPFVQWNTSTAPLAFLALPLLIAIVLFMNWHIGLLHLNPTLMLMGWRVVDMTDSEAKDGDSRTATVLCRGGVPGPDESMPNDSWSIARISADSRSSLWLARRE